MSSGRKMSDRISYIPEEIRDRILANLRIKEAARTSILSSQWRKVSSTLPRYHFDQLYLERNQGMSNNQRFRDLLIQALSLRHAPSHIHTLKINAIFDDALLSYINVWISDSVLLNIHELQLFLHRKNLPLNKLPSSFFTCETLQALTLRNVDLVLPKIIKFPSLESLTLNQVTFTDDENETVRFFASCPALQYLKMVYCELKHRLTIDSPELKVLHIDKIRIVGEIRISSRVLNQILYRNQVLQDIYLVAPLNLYRASFTVTDTPGKEIAEDVRIRTATILAGPCHIVELALLGNCVEFLAKDPDLIYHLPTSSASLKHLQLETFRTRNHVLVVTFLLRIYPNLETVDLLFKGSSQHYHQYDIEGYRGSENLSTNDILERLRIVTIRSLVGNDNELDLVKFLLENASTVEKMNIEGASEKYWKATNTFGNEEYENFRDTTVNKIQSFTRASPAVVAVSFPPDSKWC